MILSTLWLILFVGCAAAGSSSYQYVRFVGRPHGSPVGSATPRPPEPSGARRRSSRSFHFAADYSDYVEEIWPENLLENLLDIELGHGEHFTPDFSNGLAYPDPLLLTGAAAHRAASGLYGRGELFFRDVPHVRALLRLQDQRRLNGLPPNRLGSLDTRSPFYRRF